MKKRVTVWFITALVGATSIPVHAQSAEEQIQQVVTETILSSYPDAGNPGAARVEIQLGYIDPRLPLQFCAVPLEASLNQQQRPLGKLSVKVQCNDDRPWSKYLPVEVRVFSPVVVSRQSLARGSILDHGDLDILEVDLGSIRQTPIDHLDLAVGMELKQSLTSGVAITQEMLLKPKVVRRGDLVQIIAETDTITIRQQGEALQDGEVGKQINVRNSSSQLVIQAVVTAAGETRVPL